MNPHSTEAEQPNNNNNNNNGNEEEEQVDEEEIIQDALFKIIRALQFNHRILHLNNLQLTNNQLLKINLEFDNLNNLNNLKNKNNLWELDLSNNLLENIPNSLQYFLRIERLFLNNNLIKNLEDSNILQKLFYCKHLHLENNQIKNINYLPFHSLRVLNLQNNLIEILPSFIGNCKHLIELNISNNRLKYLPKELLNCKELITINLQNNPLVLLPYELLLLKKLKNLFCNDFTIPLNFYKKLFVKNNITLLELTKRFLTNMDHLLCNGTCCKELNYSEPISPSFHEEEEEDGYLSTTLISSSSISSRSSSNKKKVEEEEEGNKKIVLKKGLDFQMRNDYLQNSNLFKINFQLIKKYYKENLPNNLSEDLIDHCKLSNCNLCNKFYTPKTGIYFVILTNFKNKTSAFPFFCRLCSEDCYEQFSQKYDVLK
ncbi:hypothetical protein ABK040_003720 [Willaertia magna]